MIKKFDGIDNVYSISLKNINGLDYGYEPGIKLIYLIKGQVDYKLDEQLISLRPGEVLLLNKFDSRFIYSKDLDNLIISLDIKKEYLDAHNGLLANVRFINHLDKNLLNRRLVDNIVGLYKDTRNNEDEVKRLSAVNNILKTLTSNYINREYSKKLKDDKLINLEILSRDYDSLTFEELNLSSLSDKLHLSESYISKMIYEFCGIQFTEFVQQLKLYYGCNYLLTTSKSLEEIAELVNFNSTKSLNRLFKKYLDITPSQYRKIYGKRKNLYRYEDFLGLEEEEEEDFEGYLKRMLKRDRFEIEVDAKSQVTYDDYFRDFAIIREFNSLGRDYIYSIDRIVENISINQIIINIKYYKDKDIFVLKDTGKKISRDDLYLILDRCVEHQVEALLYLDNGQVDLTRSILEEKLGDFDKFYTAISNIIGANNMRKFGYTIDIQNLFDHMEDPKKLELYREYIYRQRRLLDEKVGTKDYNWGIEIGDLEEDKLNKIRILANNLFLDRKEDFNPKFISLGYRTREASRDLKQIFYDIKDYEKTIFSSISQLLKEINFPIQFIYIRGLFEHIDISDMDIRYRNLLMISLILESKYFLKGENIYLPEYKVVDKRRDVSYYYPRVIDDYGFFTPFYWSLFLLGQIKGSLIADEKRYMAIKNENDLYLVIYGDLASDYCYANDKNFVDLKEHQVEIKLKIDGLEGKYKVITQKLSFEHGSVESSIGTKDNYKYLSAKDRRYLRTISTPSFQMDLVDMKGHHEESISYSPFNFILKKYIKL